MKILMMCRFYYPHVGGVEKHVSEISSRLINKGYKIKIATVMHDQKLLNKEIIDGIEIYRLPSDEKWSVWRWWFKNIRLIWWADVVHIHDVFYWYLPFRFLFPFKKVYMTFHGYEGADAPGWKQILWHRLAAALTWGNICIGDFHQKWYGVKPTFVSYGAA